MLKTKRALIYTRVSTAEQIENHSLATQKLACEQFCQKEGFAIDRVFSDEGESAKSADRPQLQQLLNYCQQHAKEIDLVVVYNVSRLARQLLDHQMIRFTLGKLGVQVRAVTEAFDDTASGKLVENMLAVIAQFDNDQKAARTVECMTAALKAGDWVFQPPLGYVKPPSGGPSLVPDPERARLVQVGFARMATGRHTKREVLDDLTAQGLRTRRGERVSETRAQRA